MTDLGTLAGGSYSSGAYAINNNGQVVGYSETDSTGDGDVFLYSGGVMTSLGTLGGSFGVGYSINDSGQVVGTAEVRFNAGSQAFLYTGGTMYNLNSLVTSGLSGGVILTDATGISDNGWIVANGSDGQAYALEPDTQSQTPEPAPASLVLLATGAFALLRKRLRRFPALSEL